MKLLPDVCPMPKNNWLDCGDDPVYEQDLDYDPAYDPDCDRSE